MIRAVLALFVLLTALAAFAGDARAHAGMASHGPAEAVSVTADETVPMAESATLPDRGDRLPGHLPNGKCCMTATGCAGGSSILAGLPVLPVPARISTVELTARPDTPRGLDLPVADRPPRRI